MSFLADPQESVYYSILSLSIHTVITALQR